MLNIFDEKEDHLYKLSGFIRDVTFHAIPSCDPRTRKFH